MAEDVRYVYGPRLDHGDDDRDDYEKTTCDYFYFNLISFGVDQRETHLTAQSVGYGRL